MAQGSQGTRRYLTLSNAINQPSEPPKRSEAIQNKRCWRENDAAKALMPFFARLRYLNRNVAASQQLSKRRVPSLRAVKASEPAENKPQKVGFLSERTILK